METNMDLARHGRALPFRLILGALQGLALYGLHRSDIRHTWPATSPDWQMGLYALAVFVPVTLQLLAQHARNRACWIIVAILTVAWFYFGWHWGADVSDGSASPGAESGSTLLLWFLILVLWLLVMPFIQCRLAGGGWRAPYSDLFATAWHNKLLLAQAVSFTGLFWLLLWLWAELFQMLGMRLFARLFAEPLFSYPATCLTFAVALHLVGSVRRLTSSLLEQGLSVLKWLAIVAGLILTLFSVALIFKLPGLLLSGERAIGAAWLLWLVAVVVLFINAAYRDGTVAEPYPRRIALALRFVVPLTVLIALTALYALYVRVSNYGFTVERVWAFIVAGTALVYAAGYGAASFRSDRWMGGISRVNVAVALGMIAVIAITLTPVLSPHRIAANSQYNIALLLHEPQGSQALGQPGPFRYLKFEAGRYGREKLQELARITDHPRAAEIREAARDAIAQQSQWSPPQLASSELRLGDLVTYPAGTTLDGMLEKRLIADLRDPTTGIAQARGERAKWQGVFVDLNDDGTQEFVLLLNGRAFAYTRNSGSWDALGWMSHNGPWRESDETTALESGDVQTQLSKWKELKVGLLRYRLDRHD